MYLLSFKLRKIKLFSVYLYNPVSYQCCHSRKYTQACQHHLFFSPSVLTSKFWKGKSSFIAKFWTENFKFKAHFWTENFKFKTNFRTENFKFKAQCRIFLELIAITSSFRCDSYSFSGSCTKTRCAKLLTLYYLNSFIFVVFRDID